MAAPESKAAEATKVMARRRLIFMLHFLQEWVRGSQWTGPGPLAADSLVDSLVDSLTVWSGNARPVHRLPKLMLSITKTNETFHNLHAVS
jgi:hypothetical protein